MRSALYFGRVAHRRLRNIEHGFGYGHFLLALELSELEHVFDGRWLWSHERTNLVSLRRRDSLAGEPDLASAVRALVARELGREPRGAIFLLTQPRFLGLVFNPVSFYYCEDELGGLDAIVAEITNTPWNERHAYVLDGRKREDGRVTARFEKRFHVSPFQPMQQEYAWQFSELGQELEVRMTNFEHGTPVFDVTLALRRRALDGGGLARALALCPGFSARSLVAIYWQALRLRLKGAPFHEHPRTVAQLEVR
ncbi:MAG: DUF1365 domain-containing protein [Planctomycetes bacterium]|nr:DUF1365 domain-containing protein [Planctomycetota bacterium]